jgi:ABC-type transport system substrate-binding protein
MRLHGIFKCNTVALTSVLLALLLVIACGTAAEPVTEQQTAPAQAEPVTGGGSEPAAADTPAPTPVPQEKEAPEASQPKVDRLVVAGEVQAYETTDPYAMSPSSLPQIHVLYENLLGFNRNTLEFEPMLAESWEVAPDFMSVTFKLREGVQWHKDQGQFTAADVVKTYEAMVSEHSITTYREEFWSRVMDPADAAANFDVVGDHEITFKWQSPVLNWELFVSRIVDFTMVNREHYDLEGVNARDNPVGTGPYQLKEHQLGEGYVFERVPYDHWRVTPDFPELEYQFVPEPTTRLATLLAQESHITQLPQDATGEALAQEMGISVTSIPTNTTYYIMAGQYLPSRPTYDPDNPFLKKEVRKALNLAVNRKEIKNALFSENDEIMIGPFMHPTMKPTGLPDAEWQEVYSRWEQWFQENYQYNPEEAQRLLAEAGYPNGFTLTLYSFDRPAAPQARVVTEALALDWERIGVRVDLVNLEFQAVRGMYRQRAEKNMGVAVWLGTSRWDPLVWNRAQVHFWSDGSVGGHESEFLDTRMEQIFESVDPQEVGRLEMEMLEHNQQEYSYIPMMWVFGEFVYNPEIVAEYKTIGIHGTRDLEYVKAVPQ